MTNKRLKFWFNFYNRKYFGERLPKGTVVSWSSAIRKHEIERTHIHGKTKCSESGCRQSFIRLHSDMQKMQAVALMTMLHAMVHLDGYMDGPDDHGPRFQRQMQRLAKRGAFRDLW